MLALAELLRAHIDINGRLCAAVVGSSVFFLLALVDVGSRALHAYWQPWPKSPLPPSSLGLVDLVFFFASSMAPQG